MSIGTASMYESLLIHDRPIAWWGLDSADETVDDTGHGWTLISGGTAAVSAATLIAHGDTGLSGSRDFNGTTQAYYGAAFQSGVTDDLDSISDYFSLHVIIRPDTVSGIDTIFAKPNADNSAVQYRVVLSAGVVQLRYIDSGGTARTVSGPTLSINTTYHLVVVDDGTTIHFYRDGVETTAARTGTVGYQTAGPGYFGVGATPKFGGGFLDFFDGKLDELALWDIPLSDAMVNTWYTAYSTGVFGSTHLPGAKPTPRVMIEVAWASQASAGRYTWENMTSYCRGVATQRGRNFELDRMETGRMDFELDNLDGRFLPDNTASPYYPYVIPTRACRLRAQATTDGPVYPLFFGFTEGHPIIRGGGGFDSVARFTAADAMKTLALDKVLDQNVRDVELSGSRIVAVILDVPGVPHNVDAGQSLIVSDDIAGLNRLDHAQTVTATEGGVLFADAAGVVQFQDRHYRTIHELTSRATYGNGGGSELPFTLLEPQIDESRLFTTAAITPASGVVKTEEDANAVSQHYRRTKDVQTLHAVDNDAQAMAENYLDRYSTPRVYIPGFDVRPKTTTAWTSAISHELSHRITTVDRPLAAASVTRQHFIERIEHTITTDDWRVKIGVSPAELDSGYWLLGTGELGDTTGLTNTTLGW